jgi:hypothetical protein
VGQGRNLQIGLRLMVFNSYLFLDNTANNLTLKNNKITIIQMIKTYLFKIFIDVINDTEGQESIFRKNKINQSEIVLLVVYRILFANIDYQRK